MLDSVYHMTLNLLKKRVFYVILLRFCHLLCNVIMDAIAYCYMTPIKDLF